MTDIIRGACISDCEQYRYMLWRGPAFERLAFVMLNPSTADANLDDPTIRRCMGFAAREGFKGIDVANLYAFRATKPEDMFAAADPVGEQNLEYLTILAATHSIVVCAWGANAPAQHAADIVALLREAGTTTVCLGRTKSGAPRHPLYVRADQPLEEF